MAFSFNASITVAVACLVLSACGGEAVDAPAATPPASSSAPPPTPPAPAVQPEGAYGVTMKIQNWEDYSNDPAVLAWKQINEAVAGSINAGKILPETLERVSKNAMKVYDGSISWAHAEGYTVPPVGDVKIQSVRTSGSTSKLVTCLWGVSNSLYDKDGKTVGAKEVFWLRQKAELSKRTGTWRLATFEFDGKCAGDPPA